MARPMYTAAVNQPSEPMASQPYVATAFAISAAVPIGARRMIHHSTFCTMASSDALNCRNGSALAPTFSAAMPIAAATTSNCSTLKLSDVLAAPSVRVVFAFRPRKLLGTSPVTNAHHEPVVVGSLPAPVTVV